METPFQSKLARKPWILAEDADAPRPGDATERYLVLLGHIALLLRKFCEISVITAFIAVPLFYFFNVRQDLIFAMRDFIYAHGGSLGDVETGFARIWSRQLSPYLVATAPVLEMKQFVWLLCAGLLFPVYAFARLYEGVLRVPVFAPLADTGIPRARLLRLGILGSALLFLVWSVVTMMFFGPPVPPDAGLGGGAVGRAGFFHSLSSWAQVAGGIAYFIVLEDMVRHRRFAFKIIATMLFAGSVCAFVAVLLQFKPDWLMAVWVQFDDNLFRNNYGSLIGHNTGLSSFLIGPFLLAIALIAGRPEGMPRWTRRVLIGLLPLFAYALVLAQSRAVIPILIVAFLLWRHGMSRREPLRVPRNFVLATIAVGLLLVISQLFPGKHNPFGRSEVTLAQRVRDLTPDRLFADTRVRILAIGSHLVAQKPITGSGFGSFQYVYPGAQRWWFETYERTRLVPWARRSMHAHNEYLQTLIETGLVGMALVIAGLACAVKLGSATLRATLERPWLSIEWGIAAALFAWLMHAGVDFPLRIAPIALSIVGVLALWSAGDRLWLTPIVVYDEPAPQVKLPPFAGRGVAVRGSVMLVIAAVLALFVVCGGYLLASHGSRWYSGKVLANMAGALLETASDRISSPSPEDQAEARQSLSEADYLSKEATYFLPIDGDILYLRSRVKTGIGRSALRGARAALADHDQKRGQAMLDLGRRELESALTMVSSTLAETAYHSIYFQRALIQQMLGEYAPNDAERQQRLRGALEDLRTCIGLNPAETDAYVLLTRLLDMRRGPESDREIVSLLGLMHRIMPPEVDRVYFGEVADNLALGDYPNAHRLMRRLRAAMPDDQRYAAAYATTAMRAGAFEDARATLTALVRSDLDSAGISSADLSLSFALLSARTQQYAAALETIENRVGNSSVSPAMLTAFRMELLRRLGPSREPDRNLASEELERLVARDPFALQQVGSFLYETFRDPVVALPYLERRVAMRDPAPDLPTLMIYARCLADLGRLEEVRGLERRMATLATTAPQKEVISRFLRSLPGTPDDPLRRAARQSGQTP